MYRADCSIERFLSEDTEASSTESDSVQFIISDGAVSKWFIHRTERGVTVRGVNRSHQGDDVS